MSWFETYRGAVFFVGSFALVGGLFAYGAVRRRRQLSALIELFDDRPELQGLFAAHRLDGHYHGRALTLRIYSGSRYSPQRFHAWFACAAPFDFEMQKDSRDLRFRARMGFRSAIPADAFPLGGGAIAFSESDSQRFRNWAREHLPALGMVSLFADHGLEAITAKDGMLRTNRPGRKSTPTPEEARVILDALSRLAEALERGQMTPGATSRSPRAEG
jgi:hypothetical protein